MGNSIKLALEPVSEDIAVKAFRLQLNSEIAIDKVIVLVEGSTDNNFYTKFFNKNAFLYKSEYGCGHFRDILKTLSKRYGNRFIVIKDADFDLVNTIDYSMYPNLFLTDYHDIEIMCAFFNNEAEKFITTKMLNVFAQGLFNNVLEDIINISFIKWFNNITENKIGCNELIGCYKANVKISLEECLNKQQLKHGTSFSKDDVEKFISNNSFVDKRMITNGHDFCNALGKIITEKRIKISKAEKHLFNKVGISGKDIQNELESAFSNSDFSNTNLYKAISKWQISNNCNILAV